MGAHPAAPSRVLDDVHEDLLALIESDPERHLGSRVRSQFGRLPFLLKVLAAEEPLSLQVHPNKEQASRGYLREDTAGIPLTAPERNYRDKSDKPELICALSPFFALSGFRAFDEARSLLEQLAGVTDDSLVRQFFDPFWSSPNSAGLRGLFDHAFAYPRDQLGAVVMHVSRMLERAMVAERTLSEPLKEYAPWFLRLAERYPKDPGVLLTLLLNFVELAPGQAMFLPAGNLHAYLLGMGLEVMANSDNVLRGGMTSKHVDVAELREVLWFESFRPQVLSGISRKSADLSVVSYGDHCPEFFLDVWCLGAGPTTIRGPAIGLVLDGTLLTSTLSLKKGQQCFVSADSAELVSGPARVAWVGVPSPVSG